MNKTGTNNRSMTVRVLKYDGAEHRSWHAHLARRASHLLVLEAEFDVDVQHDILGEIRRGMRTIEYYWQDRWYNIFRFLNDDESTRIYYCNVATPALVDGNVISYVDLDIDVLVNHDLSYQVLDLPEFEANAERYGYPDEVKRNASDAVEEIVSIIRERQFPFTEAELYSPVSIAGNRP
jgi:protein associated with RNAse G/E